MQNIKPVSDSKDIMEVQAIRLLAELEEGEKSAREKGWLSSDDVEAALGL